MIGIRLVTVLNHTHGFHKQLTKHVSAGLAPEVDRLIPDTHPLVGISFDPMVRLENDEIALLIEIKEVGFLSELMLAASIYESVVVSLDDYRNRYEALHRMFPSPVAMSGRTATHMLDQNEILQIQPYAIQANELIAELKTMLQENVARCQKLSERYNPMMKEHFKGEKFIMLMNSMPDQSPAEGSNPQDS